MSAENSSNSNSPDSKPESVKLAATWLQLLPNLLEHLNSWFQAQPQDLRLQSEKRKKILFDLIQQIKQAYPDIKIYKENETKIEKISSGELTTDNYLPLVESSQGYKKYKNKLSKTTKRLPKVWQLEHRELKEIEFPVEKLQKLVFQVMNCQDRLNQLAEEKKALEFRILEPNILNRLQPLINQSNILLAEAQLIRQETLAQINKLDKEMNSYLEVVKLNRYHKEKEKLQFQLSQIRYFCTRFVLIDSNNTTHASFVKEKDRVSAFHEVRLMLYPDQQDQRNRQKQQIIDLTSWINLTETHLIKAKNDLSFILIELGLSPQSLRELLFQLYRN